VDISVDDTGGRRCRVRWARRVYFRRLSGPGRTMETERINAIAASLADLAARAAELRRYL
jgi:hypothetical protein